MARMREFPLCFFRTIAALAFFIGVLAAAGDATWAQDQSAATPADAIVARKSLMDSIDVHMTTIEAMAYARQAIDLDRGREHADTISLMLLAFPHLFPASTNQWKPNDPKRDPARDTYASPDVWKNFADFYKQAATSSKAAYDASQAEQDDEFRKAVASLRGGCNACHAAYLKTDE